MPVNVCPDDIFWTQEHFVTKPGMVMHLHKPECHAEKIVQCVQCQGHSEGLFLLLHLQTIPSESQNILLPNLVWWCSIMSQRDLQNFLCVLFSRASQRGLIWSKYDPFYFIFWTVDSLASKLDLMIHHHKPECLVKKIGLLYSRSRSQQGVKMSVFSRWYLLNQLRFCFQTWYCDTSSWVGVSCIKIGLLFSTSRSQQGLIWSKYDSFFYIF